MRFRKLLALLLSVLMAAAVLAGCNQQTKSPFVSPDASASPSAPEASPSAAAMNFEGAYAALDPKTVMLTINGKDITWDELYYYIYYHIYSMQSQGLQITDWSATLSDETTYKDYVLDSAVSFALQNAAVEYGAGQLNVSMTEEDTAAIQADWDSRVTSAGSEEALIAQLEGQYLSKDLFMKLMGYSRLFQGCFASMYGEKGSKLTDQEVADYTEQDGYMMAKHILMLTTKKDESGKDVPMSDDEKAAVRQKMEDVLSQLKSYKGDDFDGYFDELMKQYSEDPGSLTSYPDGYLFQSGDMVSAFSDATKALEIGKFSDALVESEYGYHIIYRLPINYDITPMSAANSSTDSLRLITAGNMFSAVADTWMNSLNVVYSDAYKALDFTKLFAVG